MPLRYGVERTDQVVVVHYYLGLGLGLAGSPEVGIPAARRTLSHVAEGAILSYSPSSLGISP